MYDPIRGEWICAESGEVLSDHHIVVEQPEWRAFNEEQRLRRERAHEFDPHRARTTIVPPLLGLRYSGEQKRRWKRLGKLDAREVPSSKRVEEELYNELLTAAKRLKMPEWVVEDALRLGLQFIARRRGVPRIYLVPALIYLAARRRLGVTLAEICSNLGLNERRDRVEVQRVVREVVELLDLRPPTIEDYLHRIAARLGLSPREIATALRLLEEARRSGVTEGRNPVGVAIALAVLAAQIHGRKLETAAVHAICNELGITYNTVRTRIKELLPLANRIPRSA